MKCRSKRDWASSRRREEHHDSRWNARKRIRDRSKIDGIYAYSLAMGKTKGLYKEEFTKGSMVRIADRSFLENFLQTWKLHNKLETEQLPYAGQVAEVESVGFYHGGDELYRLKGIPGVWHQQCLEAAI